jgi:DNA-binding NarL/FixJ family response regulator
MRVQPRQPRPPRLPHRRVVVASEQSLIAESVRATLADAGYDASLLGWPVGPHSPITTAAHPTTTSAAPVTLVAPPMPDPAPDLALMLCDFTGTTQVDAARLLVAQVDVPWVVLTGAPPGPAWGAVLDSGAETVMPTTTTLEMLTGVLEGMIRGRHPFGPRRRSQLVREWRDHDQRLQAARAGLRSLTPRETDVLYLLHAGVSVREISTRFEVSEATVRSQVKAVLKKLGVGTQLGAAATYHLVNEH